MRFLYFADNKNINLADPDQDKVYKVRERCQHDQRKVFFKFFFSPGKDVSIDDSLVLFKGGLSFQQYINLREQGLA